MEVVNYLNQKEVYVQKAFVQLSVSININKYTDIKIKQNDVYYTDS